MMYRNWIGVLVSVVSAAGTVWLAHGDAGVADAPAQIVPQEFQIAAAETGRLAQVYAVPGQRVRAGETLARLDTAVLEREIAVGQAHLRQLAAEPGASVASMNSTGFAEERSFQSDLDTATTQLESARGERARQAAENLILREEIARLRKLVKEGLTRADHVETLEVRSRSLDDAESHWPVRLQALQGQVQAATERLREWRSQHKSATAPLSRDARLQPLKDRVGEQREALQMLRTRLAAANIVAPADGVVANVLARPGDVAVSGAPFLVLHGTGPRVLVAYVNERARLSPGAKAIARRRTPAREELPTTVQRVAGAVVQIPTRFWLLPAMPQWGREVYLELPPSVVLDAGEAVDVTFLGGGR